MFTSVQKEQPFEGTFRPAQDHLLVLHRDGPAVLESRYGHAGSRKVVPAGSVHLIAPGTEIGISLANPLESVHVYIRRAVLEEVAADMVEGDPYNIEIPSAIIEDDRSLRALIDASACATEDETTGSALFADYMARAIAARMIRKYSNATLKRSTRASANTGLSTTISSALDYMAEHLDSNINIGDIAHATNRSASHLARLFKGEMGMPPHSYLIIMRVDKARQLLAKSSMPIAEIALECGFAHQEHLTRLFRRHMGTTPAAYRRSKRSFTLTR